MNRALPALHSAWNPYAILPPATKRKVSLASELQDALPSKPYNSDGMQKRGSR